MLKPFLATVALSFLTLTTNVYAADQFVEGQHYQQIAEKSSDTPKVSEYFSFYCHNCFNMEANYLNEIKSGLKPELKFESIHVDFMNSKIGTEVMKSLAIMEKLGVTDKLAHEMFVAIQGADGANGAAHHHGDLRHDHDAIDTIKSRENIKAVFAANGIDGDKYDELADSEEINNVIDQWRKNQVNYQIQSVPAFVVNDKYLVNIGSVRSPTELAQLINYLSEK